ncbi:pyridoxamine 5'-phosphate oxidase family protein [Streptomyces sp. NPDC051018]|uniref:pyridoxamine 5'-phosphate oxidase family protein n=1 Tax=Streptomyces sp. NPDC051018 TaxID=3365639 RepID=UPI0037919EE4
MTTYSPTPRTTPTRRRELVGYEAEAVHAVLDEALICHLGFVVADEPVVLPTTHVRVGDRVYVHGSTAARLLRTVGPEGIPVCLTVTLVDGLVLGRRHFTHSLNYRSAVVHGRARLVDDPRERSEVLAALVDHVVPGRADDSVAPDARELAATALLRIPLREASVKSRTGPPVEPGAVSGPGRSRTGHGTDHWSGVIPVETVFGPPDPRPGAPATPHYIERYTRRRPTDAGTKGDDTP